MRRPRAVLLGALAGVLVVLATGVPWLQERHAEPAVYIENVVATTDEIQQFDIMWSDLEGLQREAKALGAEVFEARYLARSLEYLQLDEDAEARFGAALEDALAELTAARLRLQQAEARALQAGAPPPPAGTLMADPAATALRREAFVQWQEEQREASDAILGALLDTPRHRLLAERRLDWLLQLDYSRRTRARAD